MRQTRDLTVASLKMLLRDRTALLGAAIFPVLFLLVFSLYDLSITPVGDVGVGDAVAGTDYFDYVLPGMLALGLMNVTMTGTAVSVARFRETGVLRRLAAAPVSPAAFIAGQVVARLVIALVQVLLLLGLGLLLGGTVVGSLVLLLSFATLGNLVFIALGIAIAGRAPTVEGANNLAALATMPLMFLSGMFFPVASLPSGVQRVAEALPITPLVDAMRAICLDGATLTDLSGPLLGVAIWVPVSFLLARGVFRMVAPGPGRRRLGRTPVPG